MNIYVGNLNFKIKESELQEIFEKYGEVTSVKIITDKHSGRSKGYGFVEMENDSEAAEAIKGLNGTSVMEREIVVNEARPKRENFRN